MSDEADKEVTQWIESLKQPGLNGKVARPADSPMNLASKGSDYQAEETAGAPAQTEASGGDAASSRATTESAGLQIRMVATQSLIPNPWGGSINPSLSEEQWQALVASVRENGVRVPLVVWDHDGELMIVCGGNRHAAALEAGIDQIPVIVKRYLDKTAAKLEAIDDNLSRRQLTAFERGRLALAFQEALAVGRGARSDLRHESTKVDARREAAQKAGVSEGTISNVRAVLDHGDEQLVKDVQAGKKSLAAATKIVKAMGGRKKDKPRTSELDMLVRLFLRHANGLVDAEAELRCYVRDQTADLSDEDRQAVNLRLREVRDSTYCSAELRKVIDAFMKPLWKHEPAA